MKEEQFSNKTGDLGPMESTFWGCPEQWKSNSLAHLSNIKHVKIYFWCIQVLAYIIFLFGVNFPIFRRKRFW